MRSSIKMPESLGTIAVLKNRKVTLLPDFDFGFLFFVIFCKTYVDMVKMDI